MQLFPFLQRNPCGTEIFKMPYVFQWFSYIQHLPLYFNWYPKRYLIWLAFNYQNQYKSASKTRRNLASWIVNAKSFPRSEMLSSSEKSVQECSKRPPRRRQGSSNWLKKSGRHSKIALRRLADHPKRFQDAPRWLQDAWRRLQETSKTPTSTPRCVHVDCKLVQIGIPYGCKDAF